MKLKNLFGISYLDPPRGKTKERIDALIESKKWGQNEGGDEIIAVLELLKNLERHPYLNSLVLKNSPIWTLVKEFGEIFFPDPPLNNPLLQFLIPKYQWENLDIFNIGFSNATNALTTLLQAHGVEGGEVVTTSYNYACAPNAIVAAGAIPRFVEMDPQTFCMDMNGALRAINSRTKAIIITHVNQMIDLLPLLQGLEKKKQTIAIFQDATAAMGAQRDGLGVGQINPPPHGASIFSLGPTKVISGLGGALIATHDYDFLRQVETLSFYGFNPSKDTEIIAFGNNYKMNELSAVIALEQLKKIDLFLERRKELKKRYDEALEPLIKKGLATPQKLEGKAVLTHYILKIEKSFHEVIPQMLKQFQILLSHWYCFHLEPIYRLKFGSQSLPVTESLADRIVFLPFHMGLEDKDVEYIVSSLEKTLTQPS